MDYKRTSQGAEFNISLNRRVRYTLKSNRMSIPFWNHQDILKSLRVIWDPMGVFVAKQGVIISHWVQRGSLRGQWDSMGGSPELSGAQRS